MFLLDIKPQFIYVYLYLFSFSSEHEAQHANEAHKLPFYLKCRIVHKKRNTDRAATFILQLNVSSLLLEFFHTKLLPLNSRKPIHFNWTSERISVTLQGISASSSKVPVGLNLSGLELELNYS